MEKFKAITREGLSPSSQLSNQSEIDEAMSEEVQSRYLCFCYGTDRPEDVITKTKPILVTHNGRTTDYPVLSNRNTSLMNGLISDTWIPRIYSSLGQTHGRLMISFRRNLVERRYTEH